MYQLILSLLAVLLMASSALAASATITFTDNSANETGFTIQRQLNGGVFADLIKLGPNITTYVDNTLVQGTSANTYCYKAFAFNATGNSAFTNTACRTIAALPTVPNAPGNLILSALSSSEIKISFADRSPNELGFHVQRRGGGLGPKMYELDANQVSMTDTGLPRRTKFDYRVSAFNDAGSSAWTARRSVKTLRQ